MESRIHFVNQVAKTLQVNHGKHEESFIFGISGKWGEGKTRFLGDLETALLKLDPSFEIYKINPWKFSTDSTSFLRNFLKIFYQKKTHWFKRVRNFINQKNSLRSLYSDTSENSIHWGWVIALTLCSGVGFWFYVQVRDGMLPLPEALRAFIIKWKWIGAIVGSAVAIPLISQIITVQRSNHAISTVDQFDQLLEELLGGRKRAGRKPIVFVDDLDRVTPSVARDVLDNLRTFFDKKDISFVVTGDHTVLERYLGKDLLSDATLPDQLEEGRRFMKKIFNVYWRLPLPIEQELEQFLAEELKKKQEDLRKIFPEEATLKTFNSYLRKYFDKNFRHIIRFLDTVLFTFQIIQQKADAEKDSEKKYFKELLENPLLVVRILMIQELCAPLFDKILDDYQLLGDLEYAVEKKDGGKINTILAQHQKDLSQFQQNFIKKFVYEEPRFFRASSLAVSDVRPFLFLAADASFGDSRGPSSEDFMNILLGGDPAQVKNALLSSGDQKAEEASKKFIEDLSTAAEPSRTGNTKTLIAALNETPPQYTIQKIFRDRLLTVDYGFINNQGHPQRMEVLKLFWNWLDKFEPDATEAFLEKFPFVNSIDFSMLDIAQAGGYTTKAIVRWLRAYSQQNANDAINQMMEIFPKIDPNNLEEIRREMLGMEETLAQGIVGDPTPDTREKRFNLITSYTQNGKETLRTKVFAQISALNVEVLNWSRTKVASGVWSDQEITDCLLNKLGTAGDFNALNQTLAFIANQKFVDKDLVWSKLSDGQEQLLIDNLPAVLANPYPAFEPEEKIASRLMESATEKIMGLSDENAKISWLDHIKKGPWLWSSLQRISLKKLGAFARSENDGLKNKYSEVKVSWGIE